MMRLFSEDDEDKEASWALLLGGKKTGPKLDIEISCLEFKAQNQEMIESSSEEGELLPVAK